MWSIQKGVAALLILPCALVLGQAPPPPPAPPIAPPAVQTQAQPLSPEQLDNLVAPIALYPDPLLAQVLAASTYPLEVVEAQQWIQQNSNLHGAELMDAAKAQNWDASVQALVAFPDALSMLNRDIRWTTDLGNAFLAQQSDVMAAVQRMRVRAQQNGKLVSTPQETVTTETQDGQDAVVIQPADPEVVYVPVYNPVYVWGPPAWGYYPPLWYPGIDFGFGFGPGIYLSSFFPGWGGYGWPGWGLGWGWGFGWFGGGFYANNFFYNHYGFRDYDRGGFRRGFGGGGREAWSHDPYHRAGVPYGNQSVASRFSNQRFAAGRQNFSSGSFSRTNAARSFAGGQTFGGASSGGRTFGGTSSSGRTFSGNNAGRTFGGTSSRNFGATGSSATRGIAPSNTRGIAPSNRSGGPVNTGRAFSGGAANSGNFGRFNQGSARGFGGNQTFRSPGSNFGSMSRSYSAPRSVAPRSFGGFSSPRSFSGGGFRGPSVSGSSRSFGGGASRSFGGGASRSFGGGASRSFGGGGGGRSFGGGGSRSFGGGGGRWFGGGGSRGGGGGSRGGHR